MAELKRTVTGNKTFSYVDDKGNRVKAQPGDTITVTARQADAFKDRLVAPEVAKAQKEASEAQAKAAAEAAQQEEDAKKPAPEQPQGQQAAKPQGKAQG